MASQESKLQAQRTDLASNVVIQTGEDDGAVSESVLGSARLDDELLDSVGDGDALLPLGRLGVELAGRPSGGPESSDLKERVRGEEGDKLLSDSACEQLVARWSVRGGGLKGCGGRSAPVAPRIPTLILGAEEDDMSDRGEYERGRRVEVSFEEKDRRGVG